MKNIIKILFAVMALVLVITAFTACEPEQPEVPENPIPEVCKHENVDYVEGKDPTCTEDGLTSGFKCRDCGEWTVAQEVDPAGHDYVIDVEVEPTCTEAGYTEKKCSRCDATTDHKVVEALGHDMKAFDEVPATCTTAGKEAGEKCTVCGHTTGGAVIPAGHAWSEVDANGNVACSECGVVVVSTSAGLTAAVQAGATNILLADGEYDVDGCGGKTLTISGTHKAIINVVGTGAGEGNGQIDYGFDGSVVTFNGVTIKTNGQTYAGYARMSATYNGCIIENTYCLYQSSTFNACTFNVSGDAYNLWTWGAEKVDINGCTFNSDGKAVLLYGTANTKLTVSATTFNDNGGLDDLKAAIEIGNDYGKSYELIATKVTVNGYEINDKGINTGSTLWGNKNSMGQDKLNVVVDGVDVY